MAWLQRWRRVAHIAIAGIVRKLKFRDFFPNFNFGPEICSENSRLNKMDQISNIHQMAPKQNLLKALEDRQRRGKTGKAVKRTSAGLRVAQITSQEFLARNHQYAIGTAKGQSLGRLSRVRRAGPDPASIGAAEAQTKRYHVRKEVFSRFVDRASDLAHVARQVRRGIIPWDDRIVYDPKHPSEPYPSTLSTKAGPHPAWIMRTIPPVNALDTTLIALDSQRL